MIKSAKINDKIINNDCMLSDKTEFFNRLESTLIINWVDSNITVKNNTFGQHIKNPYLVQYKIF